MEAFEPKTEQAESKKHHYVPQSVLRNFSIGDEKKQVWVFDKMTGKSYVSSILNAGSENKFNTVKMGEEEVNAEPLFDRIDGELAAVVAKIVRDNALVGLNARDRHVLMQGVAVQMLRTKMFRTTGIDVQQQLKKEMTKYGLATDHLHDPTMDEAKAASLMAIAESNDITDSLGKMIMQLMGTDSNSLWISDNPVTMYNSLPYGDKGLKERGTEIYFPISKNLVLAFLCPSYFETYRQKYPAAHVIEFIRKNIIAPLPMTDKNVGFMNMLQISNSSRFLYSAENEFSFAQEFLAANPQYKHQQSTIRVGEMGKGPGRYDRMPEGDILVVYGNKMNHEVKITIIEQHVSVTFTTEDEDAMKRIESDVPYSRVRVFSDGHLCKHLGSPALRKKEQDGKRIYEFGYTDEGLEKLVKSLVKKK